MTSVGPKKQRSVWLESVVGTRIYLVALMLVWSGCFAALLIVLAVVVSRPPWIRAVLAAAAAAEILWGGFSFSVLRRATRSTPGSTQ